MEMQTVVRAVRESGNFKSELRYLGRGGYQVPPEPRLVKVGD